MSEMVEIPELWMVAQHGPNVLFALTEMNLICKFWMSKIL